MNTELEKLARLVGSECMECQEKHWCFDCANEYARRAYNLGLEEAVRIAESYRRENAYNCSHVFEIARVIRDAFVLSGRQKRNEGFGSTQ